MNGEFELIDPFEGKQGPLGKPKQATPVGSEQLVIPSTMGKPKPTDKELANKVALSKAPLDPGASSVMRGLTFGLSDRLGARAMAWKQGRPYEDVLSEQFAARDAYNDTNPKGSMAAELFGGLLSGGAVSGAIKGLGGALLPKAASAIASRGILPAMARGGLTLAGGATAGGINAAAQAHPGQELEKGLYGAGTGALASGALTAAGKLAGYAANKSQPMVQGLGNWLGVTNPDKWADKTIARSLMHDKTNLDDAAHDLWSVSGLGTMNPRTGQMMDPPDAMLLDIAGPSLGSQAKRALQRDTLAKSDLDDRILERMNQQPDRLAAAIRSSISPRTDGPSALKEIQERYSKQAEPFFSKAREMGAVNSPAVLEWFKASPARMGLLKEISDSTKGHGKSMNVRMGMAPDGSFRFDEAPSVEDLLTVKKRLDLIRSNLWDDKMGKPSADRVFVDMGGVKTDYGQASEELKSFRDLLDKVTIDPTTGESLTAKGRAIAGEGFEVAKALQLGGKIRSLSEDQLKNVMGELGSEAEKEAFRTGAATALYDMTQKTANPQTRIAQLYGNPQVQKKMDMLFTDDEAKEFFSKMIGGTEKQLTKTAQNFSPRSFTSHSSEDGIPGAVLQTGAGIMSASPRSIVAGMRNMASEATAGMADEHAESLLRRLMMGPDEFQSYAQELARRQAGPLAQMGAAGKTIMSGLPVAAASWTGGHTNQNPISSMRGAPDAGIIPGGF